MAWKLRYWGARALQVDINLNCTDDYDVAKIKVKSVTDHQ